MLFNSHAFVFAFLPLVLLVFALLTRCEDRQAPVIWLLAASLFFYAWWNPAYLPLLLVSIGVNYTLGLQIARRRAEARSGARSLLILGVAINLGLIGYFKYAGFLADSVASVTGASLSFDILLPLAISFFTFQQIAYLVDVSRGQPAEPHPLRFALFVSFFPQLIAGPIVRREEMLPQFSRWRLRAENVALGLFLFAFGLAKKVVIADGVAPAADAVFAAAESGVALSPAEAWTGALAYTVQIYFDFSGYSDMAIGLARMFGIRLPINFYAPYQATSIIDFWRRWHMSLSRFLRDYLYVPLGGGRCSPSRRYTNLMATMLLGGLWHGAGWTFVVWGGLHGLYLTINHAWRTWGPRSQSDRRPGPAGRLAGGALTFAAVVLAWVFFRATSFSGAGQMLASMASLQHPSLSDDPASPRGLIDHLFPNYLLGLEPGVHVPLIALSLVAAWILPSLYRLVPPWGQPLSIYAEAETGRLARLMRWRPDWRWGLAAGTVLAIGVLGVSEQNEFLYFNF